MLSTSSPVRRACRDSMVPPVYSRTAACALRTAAMMLVSSMLCCAVAVE